MIEHKIYYTKGDFKKQVKKMEKKGWRVTNVDVKKERPCACCLLGLFSFLLPSVDTYHVTYHK